MRAHAAILAFLFSAAAAGAQTDEPDLTVEISAATGQVDTPFFTTSFPRAASAVGQSRLLGGALRAALTDDLRGELRLMAANIGVAQPAGSYRFAWIASHLSLALDAALRRRGVHVLSLGAGLALPLHGALADSQMKQRAYALANGLTGFAEQQLFTPGVIGAVPRGRWGARYARAALNAELALPLFIRVSDVRLPPTRTRGFGLAPVASFGGELAPLRRLAMGLQVTAVGNWHAPVRDRRSDAVQALLVPSLTLKRRRVRAPDATLRAVAPLSGIVERTFQLALLLAWDVALGGT